MSSMVSDLIRVQVKLNGFHHFYFYEIHQNIDDFCARTHFPKLITSNMQFQTTLSKYLIKENFLCQPIALLVFNNRKTKYRTLFWGGLIEHVLHVKSQFDYVRKKKRSDIA